MNEFKKIALSNLENLSNEEILQSLHSSKQGLSNIEAKSRLECYGYNAFIKKSKYPVIIESLLRSLNPLVAILFVAAFISGITGNLVSATIISLMIFISIIIDYVQSYKSVIAVEKLQAKIELTCKTLRDNVWEEVPVTKLVPGDIIYLYAGVLIPADSILLNAKNLYVQQSVLTGESLPVEKESTSKKAQSLYESKKVVFSGTSVISGNATAIVVATSIHSEFGKMVSKINISTPKSDFESGIIKFGLFITKTILVLIMLVFIASIYLKRDLIDSLLFAVALAVGLTPEFLPMITTVTLATAAVKMSKKKVIVKNLASIQNFGSIDILCSDKTGTLTSGAMKLAEYVDINGKSCEKLLLYSYLNSLFQSGINNTNHQAILEQVNVNPLDIAILRHEHPDISPYQKIDEIPFDFERRRSSVVININGSNILIVKGAPEYILNICKVIEINGELQDLNQSISEQLSALYKTYNKQGYRVLAVAYNQVKTKLSYQSDDEIDLTFLGFLIFYDPPLIDALEVINSLNEEGVQIKILTGDNELVAQTICQKIGIIKPNIILGNELEQLSDEEAMLKINNTLLFARVTPNQKQRIVLLLKKQGHIVGYIGDGINDVPSLQVADVGITVANAVDIAKEASNVILLENKLSVLLEGILEGRKAFGNIMKYLMMGTSSNFGNMFSMAGAIFFLPFLPMLPIQIILNNLLYDIAQLTIPTDNVDKNFIKKPRHWDIDIIRRFMLYIGPISSIFDFLTFYVMLKIFSANETLFQTGWFLESLTTQILVIFVIRTASNSFNNLPSLPLVMNIAIVWLISFFLPFSPIASMLGFVPLPFYYFVFLFIATFLYLFIVQYVKQRLMWKWFE